jgi:hypothetical protein
VKSFWSRDWWDAFWERWPAAEYAIQPLLGTLVFAVALTVNSDRFEFVLVMTVIWLVVSSMIQGWRYHRRVTRRLRKG